MDSIYVDNMTDDKYVYSIYSVIVADWDTIYVYVVVVVSDIVCRG